jgi:hypothetical protein
MGNFNDKIEPIVKVVEKLCEEYGYEFYA